MVLHSAVRPEHTVSDESAGSILPDLLTRPAERIVQLVIQIPIDRNVPASGTERRVAPIFPIAIIILDAAAMTSLMQPNLSFEDFEKRLEELRNSSRGTLAKPEPTTYRERVEVHLVTPKKPIGSRYAHAALEHRFHRPGRVNRPQVALARQ
jgi:hypothetical protein